MRRTLAGLLRWWADRLEPPQPPSEFDDSMALLAIEQRQAMRDAFRRAARTVLANRVAEREAGERQAAPPEEDG